MAFFTRVANKQTVKKIFTVRFTDLLCLVKALAACDMELVASTVKCLQNGVSIQIWSSTTFRREFCVRVKMDANKFFRTNYLNE